MSTTTAAKGARSDRAAQLRNQIDGSLDQLAKAVDSVRESEAFRQFLDVQAKFHRYSWHNTMLIARQRPDATQVAGFRKWQQLDRHVRKGQKGISIFAPCPFKKTVTGDDGQEETRHDLYFKVVHVFDVGQTEGQDLPTVDVPDVQVAADQLLASLGRVAVQRGIKVTFTDLDEGHFGTSKGGHVEIATGHTTGQQAKTLAHELSHEALHKDPKVRAKLDRNTAELEAESVAYVVCRHFQLDVEVRASRYIALWGGNSKALRDSLERISSTARNIIDDVEGLQASKAVA